jgi:di/tricarboxylate transporter
VKISWKTVAPLGIWLAIYLVPVPAGLNVSQWHYFAVFAAVIAGLILESMPVGAVGLIGLTVAGVSGYVESDPNKSLRWMLVAFPRARCGSSSARLYSRSDTARADWAAGSP